MVRDAEGKVYTGPGRSRERDVAQRVPHSKMEKQEATIAQLKKELQATAAHPQKQIEALTTGL